MAKQTIKNYQKCRFNLRSVAYTLAKDTDYSEEQWEEWDGNKNFKVLYFACGKKGERSSEYYTVQLPNKDVLDGLGGYHLTPI